MDCSSLNSDLYRKHIIPSPSCRCGGFESVQHFFFSSPIYTVARERYLPADLRSYSVKDLLHGKTNLTSQEMKPFFASTGFHHQVWKICIAYPIINRWLTY